MYKLKDGKFTKIEREKKLNNENATQKRISELERQIAEMEINNNNKINKFANMSDSELSALAKEHGISVKSKERREIIDELINIDGVSG